MSPCFMLACFCQYMERKQPCHHHRYRDQSRYGPSQWEMSLQCSDICHWLGAHLDWSLQASCVMPGINPSSAELFWGKINMLLYSPPFSEVDMAQVIAIHFQRCEPTYWYWFRKEMKKLKYYSHFHQHLFNEDDSSEWSGFTSGPTIYNNIIHIFLQNNHNKLWRYLAFLVFVYLNYWYWYFSNLIHSLLLYICRPTGHPSTYAVDLLP